MGHFAPAALFMHSLYQLALIFLEVEILEIIEKDVKFQVGLLN